VRKINYRKSDVDQLIKTAGDMHSVCIYDTEYHRTFVRVFIDRADGTGINIKDCERVLSTLNFLMLGKGMGNISLEVSSPGVMRPLKRKWHFQSVLGKTVYVQMHTPIKCYDEQMQKEKQLFHLKAQLFQCQEQAIILKKEDKHFTIPFEQIKRANIVF